MTRSLLGTFVFYGCYVCDNTGEVDLKDEDHGTLPDGWTCDIFDFCSTECLALHHNKLEEERIERELRQVKVHREFQERALTSILELFKNNVGGYEIPENKLSWDDLLEKIHGESGGF